MNFKVIGLAACLLSISAAANAQGIDISGKYHRTKPALADLSVTKVGTNWKIEIVGGGLPAGGATAADCEMVAVGPFQGSVLTAHVIPFKGKQMSVDAALLADGEKHDFVIRFQQGGAQVIEGDVAFCGTGSDLDGRYTKTSK